MDNVTARPNAYETAARYEKAHAIATQIRRAAPCAFDPRRLTERTFLLAAGAARVKPPSPKTCELVRQLLVSEVAP